MLLLIKQIIIITYIGKETELILVDLKLLEANVLVLFFTLHSCSQTMNLNDSKIAVFLLCVGELAALFIFTVTA